MSNDLYHNAKLLFQAARLGNTAEVERLSAQTFENSWLGQALVSAARYGHIECVKVLIKDFGAATISQTFDKNWQGNALVSAAYFGHIECVKVLTKGSRFSDKGEALAQAAAEGHDDCVQFLIPLCRPTYQQSMALRLAALGGHAKCVELLIPVSNPQDKANDALRAAVEKKHPSCIDLLYPVSNPHAALRCMQKHHPHSYDIWGVLQQRVEAETLHQEITMEVGSSQTKRSRKM